MQLSQSDPAPGTSTASDTRAPEVSIIVPARNEEVCLGACLRSLVAQQGVDFEVIVVDDGSTDRTRAIAESFPSVRVIEAGPLANGWSGKSNAAMTGARSARGRWLLFTDADTVHAPDSLARALAEANQHGATLLSYSPRQELHGLLQLAVMPVIFAELARTYRPKDVCDPHSTSAAANGQYLLISRNAYDQVGGHAAVAYSLLEDVELARAVKDRGGTLRFRFSGNAVRTRMYRSFAELREGWTKNLVLLFDSPTALAASRLAEFTIVVGGAAAAVLMWRSGPRGVALFAGAAATITHARVLLRVSKAHAGAVSTVLSLFGLPLFSYLLVRSQLYYKWGRVTWKGRRYAMQPRQHDIDGNAAPSACAVTGE